MRSKLFVPASRPELFEKALTSEADGISFDLEDAVLEHKKPYAREKLHELLHSQMFKELHEAHGKKIIVRINGMDSAHFEEDLAVTCDYGVDMINIPKIDTRHDALKSVQALEAQEAKAAKSGATALNISVLANIETPTALQNAADIAAAHQKIWGLQLGLGDLFEPLNIARYEPANVHAVMFTLRIAAGAAHKIAYDSAYTNVADLSGYKDEARRARQLGFLGKTCVHPSQIAVANEVFSPTEEEIRWAEKILASATVNTSNGAYMLDGRMIDAPFIERARSIVAQANTQKAPHHAK